MVLKPYAISLTTNDDCTATIDGDIGGALNAGMKSVLVKTGKFHSENLQNFNFTPNYIINSIADLPSILNLA